MTTDGQSVRVNDLDGAEPWTANYAMFNPAGQLEFQDVLNDNGTGTETGFNNTGAGDWISYVATFQNGWQETAETDYYNDGTRAVVTYDTAGQAWDSNVTWYDGANRLTEQDTFYDDGTVAETGYNVAGAGDWTAYTAIFDAAGNRRPGRRGVAFLKEAVPKLALDAGRRRPATADLPMVVASKRHNLSSRLRQVRLAA